MTSTFISYAAEDKERVAKLVRRLEEKQIEVWVDFKNLQPGKNFDSQIEKALDAARCVVGCWSKEAQNSDFVRDEMRRAYKAGKLIPVRIDELEPMLGLGNLQYVDLISWDYLSNDSEQFVALVTAITKRLEQSDVPRALSPRKATLAEVADQLLRELDYVDADFKYDSSWFTPLQAQVRVRSDIGGDDEDVCDLLTALEDPSASKITAVLGLPGSGKSVAMREFARHGLAKTARTGILALYINLRDWLPEHRWSPDNPPRMKDLERFIEACLTFENNPAVTAFLAGFRELHADGRILWIFDSFDELPGIIDASLGPTAELIKTISKLLDDFVRQGGRETQHGARGVIASRFERKPQLPSKLVTLLEIQPFSDDKIRDAFMRIEGFNHALIDDIFRPPGDLVPIARTPFYHGLISEHTVATGGLPATTAQLFEGYVLRRLKSVFDAEVALPLVETRIREAVRLSEEIAHSLFDSVQYGLGAPLAALKGLFPGTNVDEPLRLLQRAKIMRRGPPPNEIVTFSHRRMHEYFVVRYKARANIPFDLDWVARDARERDSAVLHVELADANAAREIARGLWSEVEKGSDLDYSDPQFFRALHCQRFLVEAFRTRRDAIADFRKDMERLITQRLEKSDDIISVKLSTEAIGLLTEQGIERNVLAALRRGDFWIRETAIDACRFIPSLPPRVVGDIWRCVAFMKEEEFVRDIERLRFSFRLSPSLKDVSSRIEARAADIRRWRRFGWWASAVFRLVVVPVALMASFLSNRLPRDWHRSRARLAGSPILLYVSDPRLLAMSNFNLEYEPGNFESWLKNANADRRFGLSIYRSTMASRRAFFWLTLIFGTLLYGPLAAILAIAISPAPMQSVFRDPGEAFVGLLGVLWVGGFLAGKWAATLTTRGYDLSVDGEIWSPKTWRELTVWLVAQVPVAVGVVIGFALAIGVFFGLAFAIGMAYHVLFGGPVLGEAESTTGSAIIVGIAFLFGLGAIIAMLTRVFSFFGDAGGRVAERRRSSRDANYFRRICALGHHSRGQIEENFTSFETPRWREAYVDWLIKQGVAPVDEWPSGRPPNLGDPASTKLARLEHRWRGFER